MEKKSDLGHPLGIVTVEALRKALDSHEIWREALKDSETPTFRILQSEEFKDEFFPNSIKIEVLMSFALLHCHNEQGATAKVFY